MRDNQVSLIRPARPSEVRTGRELELLAERIRGWYAESAEPTERNARLSIKCQNYYHLEQLSGEERMELAERGQPDIVLSRLSPSIDVLLGSERRARTQPEYLPSGQFDEEKARIITALDRRVTDDNGTKYEISDVFTDLVLAGIGWLFQGENPFGNGPRIVEYMVPWEEMMFDQTAKRTDLSDRRWTIRHRWHRAEEVLAWMPQHKRKILDVLGQASGMGMQFIDRYGDDDQGDIGSDGLTYYSAPVDSWDKRDWLNLNNPLDPWIHVGECWYKEFHSAVFLTDPNTGRQVEFDERNPTEEQIMLLLSGGITQRKMSSRIRRAYFAGPMILSDGPSPYAHGDCPYEPAVCYRDRMTKKMYGVAARMLDATDLINRAFASMYNQMSTRQIWIENGAAENLDDVAVQASDPGGVIQLNPGGLAKYRIEDGGDRVRQSQSLMMLATSLLGENTGTNDEMMGRESNARTAVAIDRRIERGSTVLGPVFDNLYRFKWRIAKKRLALIKQFIDGPTAVRYTDDQGAVQYVTANLSPELSIADADVDVVINEAPEQASARQAMAQTMMMVAGKLPEDMARIILPLAVEMMDMPGKQKFLAQLNAMPMIPTEGLNSGTATAA